MRWVNMTSFPAYTVGCCVTPLLPLGSFEDHAYIVNDAEIEAFVYLPSKHEHRANEIARVAPSVRHFLAFAETEFGEDYAALAARHEPAPSVWYCFWRRPVFFRVLPLM